MRTVPILLCSFLLVGCARDHFALIDLESGQEIGRFAYRTGEKLTLGERTYQIKRIGSHTSETEQYLEMTIVPEVDMCYANLHDVVDFLSKCVVEFGPTNVTWTTPLPSISLDLSGSGQEAIPLVTIRGVRDISLLECLRRVCRQTDLRLEVDRQYVWLRAKKEATQ